MKCNRHVDAPFEELSILLQVFVEQRNKKLAFFGTAVAVYLQTCMSACKDSLSAGKFAFRDDLQVD